MTRKKTKNIASHAATTQTPRPQPAPHSTKPPPQTSQSTKETVKIPPSAEAWYAAFQSLKLAGSNREIALHSYAQHWDMQQVELWLSPSPLLNQTRIDALHKALTLHLSQDVQITLEKHALTPEQKHCTPQALLQKQKQEAHQVAIELLESAPFVQALQRTFNARLLPETIRHKSS